MALDPMAQELVNETMTAIQGAAFKQPAEVLISPRRMRALILYSQQRMGVQLLNGVHVTLVEDNDAPELASAIEAALQVPDLPEPVLPPEPQPSKTVGQHKAEKATGKRAR